MSDRLPRRTAALLLTPLGAPVIQPDAPRQASLLHLLTPKLFTARARSAEHARGRLARFAILGVVGCLFWAFVLGILIRVLTYFHGAQEIGALLAGKLLGLMFVSFLGILLLSNIIAALSTFYLARDLDLLVSAPVDWLTLYAAKLVETLVHSSWMVVLMAVPIFVAYGRVYHAGPIFVLVALGTFLPFLVVPTVVGGAITTCLVNIFPARRARDILGMVTVLAAAGVALLFRLVRPERLARPEGMRSLVDVIEVLRTPTSPFLPSEWVRSAVMSSLTGTFDPLPFYLLWSTAAAAVVLGAVMHRALYGRGFTKAQEGGSERATRSRATRAIGRLLGVPFGVLRRELILKELRVFFRDSTQWSQLILLAVLVVVYTVNVKFLPLRGDGITFFLVNVVPFLNLVLAGFVLASIAARFIFPAVSVEGRTFWLLRSSPMPMRSLLWSKFWTGTLPLLVLAVGIVAVTDVMLQVSDFMMIVSVLSIVLMTFAIAGLALGLGTMFPQFETENVAQIPTSFGGLVFMMASVALIGAVVIFEARPVYSYLRAVTFGGTPDPTEMVVGFGLAAALCIATTLVPIRMALHRLDGMEH
jgi:ABC-2 type transport system permease protein